MKPHYNFLPIIKYVRIINCPDECVRVEFINVLINYKKRQLIEILPLTWENALMSTVFIGILNEYNYSDKNFVRNVIQVYKSLYRCHLLYLLKE